MIIKNLPTTAMPAQKHAGPDARHEDFSDTLKDKVASVTDRPGVDHSGKKASGAKKSPSADESKSDTPAPQAEPSSGAVVIAPVLTLPVKENADSGTKGNAVLAPQASLQPWGVQMSLPADVAISQQPGSGQGSSSTSTDTAPALEVLALTMQPELAIPQEATDSAAEAKSLPGVVGQNPFEGLSAQKLSEAAGEAITVNKSPLFPATERKLSDAETPLASAAPAHNGDTAPIVHDAPLSASENMPDVSLTMLAKHQEVAQTVQTAVPTTATLNQQLGTPAWQQSLGQQLTLFTRNGVQNAELRLHPEELGALQINLRLNNDRAQLHFVTGNHQVRAALEAAMPHLRTSLEESGISLGQTSVGADASSWSSSHSEQRFTAKNPQEIRPENTHGSEEEREIITKSVNLLQGINTFV